VKRESGSSLRANGASATPSEFAADTSVSRPTVGLLLTPEHETEIRTLLAGQNLSLQTVTTAEAKSWSRRNSCLLISHEPPEMDCLHVLETIRTSEARLPLACVVLSVSAHAKTVVSAIKAGALNFLATGGLTRGELRSTIGAAIESFERSIGLDRQSKEFALLAAIVASSTDAIVSLEADGSSVRTWSPGAIRLFGYTADDAVGRTVDELIIPASKLQERAQIYDRIRRQSNALIVETERRHKDGSLIPVEINVSPMTLNEEVVIGYSVVFRDLRERRKVEKAVRETLDKLSRREGELARAQRIAGIGSYEVDVRDSRFMSRRSPEYLRIHGLSAEDRVESHEDWAARVHPEDRERADKSIRDAVASNKAEYETEYRIIRRADGAVRWVRVLAEFDRAESGAPTRLFGTHIDITEQKLAAETLRASEVRLRLAIAAAKLGLFEIDWETRQRHWSLELRELLGVPDALDVTSDLDLMSRIIPPDQLERYKSKLLSSFDPSNAEYEDEHEVICLDGQRRHVLLRARTMFADGADGPRAVRTVGFMMDITHHKRAEQQRELLLRELDHRIRNIFSTVSSIISLSAHTAENVGDYTTSAASLAYFLTDGYTRPCGSAFLR
jgi:PAS domain S-box-containing protein